MQDGIFRQFYIMKKIVLHVILFSSSFWQITAKWLGMYVLTFSSFNFLFCSLQFDEFLFCIIQFLKPVVISANMGSTRSNFVVFETDKTNCWKPNSQKNASKETPTIKFAATSSRRVHRCFCTCSCRCRRRCSRCCCRFSSRFRCCGCCRTENLF